MLHLDVLRSGIASQDLKSQTYESHWKSIQQHRLHRHVM